MTFEINAVARDAQGTGASRRQRRDGRLPAIVYGGDVAPVAVTLDHNSMYYALQKEAFHTALIKLNIEGAASEQVLVRAVQYHPFKQLVLHVDLQRVNEATVVELKVPLHFINGDTCLGVKMQGGSISTVLNEVMVRCVASKLPEFVTVDLGDLSAMKTSVHLSDIKLADGIELVSLASGKDLGLVNLNGAKAV
ncbi:50S ribosomal protein L25/general stress protein Ctc [Iodobacter ciconiae]|uniref:Large ribosomal subunit protein bL25 n=1 Tax=Iodobacter ciconiae TaxID=2496266 RepID=A0A3S8ZV94_9NEIS|nr:50S ribosomal protein L25/general stress protein Ctc [Iodobacter ciconiae]AZN37381.1 50S ribosomal protein L25/general stress protein Ctc [Iodobacter ciconiae]